MEYPVHSDMHTSPGCWAIFCELLGREFSDPSYWPAHMLTVNAYALQHRTCNPALHLLALYLRFERRFSDEQILPAMRRAKEQNAALPDLPAAEAGALNVLHAHAARDTREHIASVTDWAQSVWRSYERSHRAIGAAAFDLGM